MADAPIDMNHLARYTGGDRTLNTEILRLFNGQLNSMVDQLLTVLQQRDVRRWREVTHSLKGAARGVGAFAVGEAAAAAEPIDPTLSQDRAIQVIEVLRVEGEAVQAFIEEYLAAA
ncbi:MAG TPA: Hpt domain-containing protein [Rhizomicrobium sp.]|jgi:HPt (histidine-containing phosphotransfer) domain-containing protein|nr:Hpt domain-containing protein [Rhizomicrobium sp.]